MVLVKALGLGLVAGIVPFALVAGGLWLVLVEGVGMGSVGVAIAIVFGGLSGLKWFFASASRYLAENAAPVSAQRPWPGIRAGSTPAEGALPTPYAQLPDAPAAPTGSSVSAEAELLPISETLPIIPGRMTLTRGEVLFHGDDGPTVRLPLTLDADWSVWDGTVVLNLGFNVRIMGFGNWDLRILDKDVEGWGKRLSDQGVPRRTDAPEA